MKTFTLDEAQSLLPVLESLLKRAIEGKKAAEEIEAQLQQLRHRIFLSGGMMVDILSVTRQKAEAEKFVRQVPHFEAMFLPILQKSCAARKNLC
ncbi:MAG: DUF2203 domain-containing protein [Acidobacterium ailaaui]|nr:DUF2203 domain-containing protein [Pseudacidobacterium ailaaui]